MHLQAAYSECGIIEFIETDKSTKLMTSHAAGSCIQPAAAIILNGLTYVFSKQIRP